MSCNELVVGWAAVAAGITALVVGLPALWHLRNWQRLHRNHIDELARMEENLAEATARLDALKGRRWRDEP